MAKFTALHSRNFGHEWQLQREHDPQNFERSSEKIMRKQKHTSE
ncbi:MAG: hypothetical protein ACREDL_20050 [Bradyrhizobium sp.]